MRARPIKENLWQLYCDVCGEATDVVDREEFRGVAGIAQGEYVCFGCESARVDELPGALYPGYTPYVLRVNKTWFVVDPWGEAGEKIGPFVEAVNRMQEQGFCREDDWAGEGRGVIDA